MNGKKIFLQFIRSDKQTIAFMRDLLVAAIIVMMILLTLWAFTGQWFGAPMVAIESNSMTHPDEPFGRIGTIDAGDMVFLVKVYKHNDVLPYGGPLGGALQKKDPGYFLYGTWGDVIVYHPLGKTDETQVIHRAMCWVDVEYQGEEKTYTIKDQGIFNEKTLLVPELGIKTISGKSVTPDWSHSGFITKGDNNELCDQLSNICPQPVKLEWISGKAWGELPWIGTINLLFSDVFGGKNTLSNVASDSLICLVILIAVLISIPLILDFYDYFREKKGQKNQTVNIDKKNQNY